MMAIPAFSLRQQAGNSIAGYRLLLSGLRDAPSPQKWYGVAITGAMLCLCLNLNQNTIWAAVRFSKVLAVPLGWFWGTHMGLGHSPPWRLMLIGLTILGLMATQFAHAWYLPIYRGLH